MRADGHHCVTVDLPGHGGRLRERYTLAAAGAAIDEAVASCPTPPLLVGLSLGGYSALAYAAEHQGRLAGVLLAACTTRIRTLPVDAYRVLSGHTVRLLRPGVTSWHVVTDMLRSVRRHDFLADLRRLHRPVWLVNGSRDPMRLDERRYAAALPGCRLVVVPRAGHDVNLHAPAAFNRVLREAMTTLRVAPAPALA